MPLIVTDNQRHCSLRERDESLFLVFVLIFIFVFIVIIVVDDFFHTKLIEALSDSVVIAIA